MVERDGGFLYRQGIRRSTFLRSVLAFMGIMILCSTLLILILPNRFIWNIRQTGKEEYQEPHEQYQSALVYATQLLSFIEQFVDEQLDHPNPDKNQSVSITRLRNLSAATPESVLSQYYETDLTRLNNDQEKDISSGYAENVVHSDTYWSPFHATRRGYGLEGSIFIGIVHNEEQLTSTNGESTCALTVQSVYDAARWPLSVFTGIVEVTLDTTQPPTRSTQWRSWSSLPPSVCVPRAYSSPDCAERFDFCPTDNIRVRRLRVRPFSAYGKEDARQPPRRRTRSLFSSIAARRYATLTLYRGETYVMFIHSGLQLVLHWDILTRLLWLQLPSRYAVLSQSPVTISQETVRQIWESVVEKHVHKIIVKNRLFNLTTNTKRNPREEKDNKKSLWPAQWALNMTAVRLHQDENKTKVKLPVDDKNDLGITVEEIVNYILFRGSIAATALDGGIDSLNDLGTNTNINEKTVSTMKSRRDIQIYWLHHLCDHLWQKLRKEMQNQKTTSCVCGVKLKENYLYQQEESLFKLHITTVKRVSHALQDSRYMQPSYVHWCGETDGIECIDMSIPTKKGNDVELIFMHQPFATTDFFFTRAEAFFDFQHTDQNYYRSRTRGADSLELDPYLSLLTSDEEAVLLSARLWTHGWDFFSPTEPIAFVAGNPSGDEPFSTPETTYSEITMSNRRQSLARLHFILFGTYDDKRLTRDDKEKAFRDVGRYSLGSRRSREKMLCFFALKVTQKCEGVQNGDEYKYEGDALCHSTWCSKQTTE